MLKILTYLVLGFAIGITVDYSMTPDSYKLQVYSTKISYLAGRWEQSKFDDPVIGEATQKAVCNIYREDGLGTPPKEYLPSTFDQELSNLCQQ